MFSQIAAQLANVPESTWVILAGVLGLSAFQQTIKHYVGDMSERTNTLITVVLSGVLASSDYLTNAAAQNPTILGPETAAILGLMTVAYRYVVKPFYNLLIDAKALRVQQRSAIAAKAETAASTLASPAAATATPAGPADEFGDFAG